MLDRLFPLDTGRAQRNATLLLSREGQVLDASLAPDDRWRFSTKPEDVEPFFLALLQTIEDQRFTSHIGIDPLAILRAIGQDISAGHIVSGASTLTMQVARLLEPRPRTMASKVIEALRALQLEARLSKQEILSLYLTLAPYGSNIEGIRAASLGWFGKEPRQLTLPEAALLVALPQQPERIRPDRHPAAARQARNKILDRAAAAGLVSATQATEAKQAPLPTSLRPMPAYAPHLIERLAHHTPDGEIHTTLNAGLQKSLSTLLAHEATSRHEPEVTLAAIIVESESGCVRAYVGNAVYTDRLKHGMVDIIPSIRSPGSTLKPFIYGLGFDRLLIHPSTVISDIPLRFGAYAPENFGGGYHGEVTVREALQQSLNLPAVAVLDRIGPVVLDTALANAGVPLQFDRRIGKATLPIALGGVGISLENLARLYASLSRDGIVPTLVYTADEPRPASNIPATKDKGRSVMTPQSAWYISRILECAPRPRGVIDASISSRTPTGYKTGTSYGFRDAWALGTSGDYTIGVWVGRADGRPCAQCVGLMAAAPVLLQIVDHLPAQQNRTLRHIPDGVIQATGDDLPPSLQRFSLKGAPPVLRPSSVITPPLRLSFPIDNSTIELQADTATLPLRAENGQRPLSWTVNGVPLPSDPLSRTAVWSVSETETKATAAELGFSRITVQDTTGATASALVLLKRGEEQ